MLKEGGTHQKPAAITKAKIELKNQVWEGTAQPMGDPLEKTKSTKSFTPTKNIISISIEFTFANIDIPIESVSNGVSISDSAYLLALNIFISKISKETLNGEELKQLHLNP